MESSVRDPMVIVHVILISVQVRIGCVLFGKLMLRNPILFTAGRGHFCQVQVQVQVYFLIHSRTHRNMGVFPRKNIYNIVGTR